MSLTLSAPVEVTDRLLRVAAADVDLRHFEAAALPLPECAALPGRGPGTTLTPAAGPAPSAT
ncbi:hypothetical protein ACGF3G_45075 [Streptomyces sp. NPDC048179]|uniref:hypothetical protein n=1 Tax=Streptomyces sp. NPDC048179 TaxID=3365506 RepID=UPI00371180AF